MYLNKQTIFSGYAAGMEAPRFISSLMGSSMTLVVCVLALVSAYVAGRCLVVDIVTAVESLTLSRFVEAFLMRARIL